MLSFTARQASFTDLTNASDSSTTALAARLMNQSEKRILTSFDWPFLEGIDSTLVTVASQQAYNIPQIVSKPKSIYVTVSSQRHVPREITSREEWDRLNRSVFTSDQVQHYYVFGRTIELWPKPASSSNTISIIYRKTPKDLTIADYTTGTIVTLTAAGVVTGSGTTFTASMVGRYLRVAETNAALGGDGFWYLISGYTSATVISLSVPYAGTAIAAGAATYAIGQMSLLPEGFTDLPIFDAVRQYFATIQPDTGKFTLYDGMYKELWAQMIRDQASKSTDPVLDDGLYRSFSDPNLFITY